MDAASKFHHLVISRPDQNGVEQFGMAVIAHFERQLVEQGLTFHHLKLNSTYGFDPTQFMSIPVEITTHHLSQMQI